MQLNNIDKTWGGGTEKVLWISVANILSSFGVVVLHADNIVYSFPKGSLWYISNFLITFFYWPVPIFYMITGITLADYRDKYSTGEFFKKRIERTVIPFCVWSIISVLYRYILWDWPVESIKDIIGGIFNHKYNPVYWFFVPLFAIYLSLPLITLIDRTRKVKIFRYIVTLTFIFTSVCPVVFSFVGIRFCVDIQLPVSGGYMIYVMIGYVIANSDFSRLHRCLLYLTGVLGWGIQFFGDNIISFANGKSDSTFQGYLNFPAAMQAVGVMVFFKYFPWQKIIKGRGVYLINRLSKYSYGVFLIHYFFIEMIPRITGIYFTSGKRIIAGAILVYFLSVFLCMVIGNIPVLRRAIGITETKGILKSQ